MKVNFKLLILGIAALSMTSLQSCSDDENYDVVGNPNNLAYFNYNADNTLNYTVVHTPNGDIGEFTAKLAVKTTKTAKANETVNAEIDNSLVDSYNEKNKTNYVAMPSDLVKATKLQVSIPTSGQMAVDSIEITVPQSSLAKLTEPTYIIPVRLTSSNGCAVSEDRGEAYIIVKTMTKQIHDGVGSADMLGSAISLEEMGTWTCKENEMWIVCDNNVWSCWNDMTTYTIDMQSEHKVTGLSATCCYASYGYIFSTIALELSADGTNWTDCGVADYNQMANEGGWQYLGLYGGVNARYMKVTFNSLYNAQWTNIGELRVYAE